MTHHGKNHESKFKMLIILQSLQQHIWPNVKYENNTNQQKTLSKYCIACSQLVVGMYQPAGD